MASTVAYDQCQRGASCSLGNPDLVCTFHYLQLCGALALPNARDFEGRREDAEAWRCPLQAICDKLANTGVDEDGSFGNAKTRKGGRVWVRFFWPVDKARSRLFERYDREFACSQSFKLAACERNDGWLRAGP